MRIFFDDLLDGEENTRPQMGRVNMAEEHLIKRLMSSSGGLSFRHFAAARRNPVVPALKTSRPTSAAGGQSFVFSVKGWHSPGRSERFCVGPRETAVSQELRYSPTRRHMGGVGAYRFQGAHPPQGMREVSTFQKAQLRTGGAGAFQNYIERDGAIETAQGVEASFGNIHAEHAFREVFWDEVERREGAAKRVQTRIIAELPFEPEIGPEGRREILKELGAVIERHGLPWHGVVHTPEQQSDPRNYHLHLLFHDRPLLGWDNWDLPIFGDRKNTAVRAHGFIKQLRSEYAEIVNRSFEKSGLTRRWDPRTYKEMGIDKPPQQHLGSAVMGLERRGIVTAGGKRVAQAEEAWRYRNLAQERTIKLVGMADRLEGRIEEIETSRSEPLSPSVRMAQAGFLEQVTRASRQYIRVADWRHQKGFIGERHRMLRSRLELMLEDPEFGPSSGKYLQKLDRFYMRMAKNVGDMQRSAEERLRVVRRGVIHAREGYVVESLVDRLHRANGAIERAVGAAAMAKRQRSASDGRYKRLLTEQQAHLRARAKLQKSLPPGISWEDLEEKVQAGAKAWDISALSYIEVQNIVAGVKASTRSLERMLRREKNAQADSGSGSDESGVAAILQARAQRAEVLRDIRKSGLAPVIKKRVGNLLGARNRPALRNPT